jgi:hypothetical protein
MWPRGDLTQGPGGDMTASRRNKSSGLSGFVSFMKRKDAEAALRELDGFDWGGSVLRVGWSKAVPVGSKALYSEFPGCDNSYICLFRAPSHEKRYRRRVRGHVPDLVQKATIVAVAHVHHRGQESNIRLLVVLLEVVRGAEAQDDPDLPDDKLGEDPTVVRVDIAIAAAGPHAVEGPVRMRRNLLEMMM